MDADAARRGLADEYLRVFGVPWDQFPWGEGTWPEVMAEARALDRQFTESAALLRRLLAHLDEARGLLANRGFDQPPSATELSGEDMLGLTLPEVFLLTALGADAPLRKAHTIATRVVDWLSNPEQWQAAPQIDDLPSLPWPNRGIRSVHVPGIDSRQLMLVAGIPLPPPRTLENEDEWRRRVLVQVLMVRSRRSPHGNTRRMSDRDMAIINLLAGAIDTYSPRELSSLDSVIERERRAVIAVRRRQQRALLERDRHTEPQSPSVEGGDESVPGGTAVHLTGCQARSRALGILRSEYLKTFGVAWDCPPWGGGIAWPATAETARAQDRWYNAAQSALEKLASTLEACRKYLDDGGFDLDGARFTSDSVTGKSLPTAYLYWLWVEPVCSLAQGLADVREALSILEERWDFCFSDLEYVPPNEPEDPPPAVVGERILEWFVRACQSSTHRGIRLVESLGDDGRVCARAWAPGIGGPPPRSVTSWAEWRRAYLVDVLGDFVGPRVLFEKNAQPIADRAIAVVSLLLSGLEVVPSHSLRKVEQLVSAERKAIALVRKRRTAAWQKHAERYPRGLQTGRRKSRT